MFTIRMQLFLLKTLKIMSQLYYKAITAPYLPTGLLGLAKPTLFLVLLIRDIVP